MSLGSEAKLIELFQRHGGELMRLEIAKSGKAGSGKRLRLAAGRADHPVAGDEAMIVAGVGFRRGTSADEIERVVRLALGVFQLPAERLDAIATESAKATEAGFPEAARRLSVRPMACTVDDLDRVAGQVLTRSKLVLEAKGRAVDRRGVGAGRGRPQRAPAGHARGDGARDLRHRHRRGPMTVHFIGAGPGAPDLITVRGRDLIARCPVCLYAGSLVPKALLDHCPAGARIVDTAPMSLDEIVAECRRATDAGPGRGAPAFRRSLGLERDGRAAAASRCGRHRLHVTPGVPSFAAAAAALGQELTLPEVAQSVVLTRTSGRASAMPAGETLAAYAATGATLAIHLSIHVLDKVVAELVPFYGADCPVAVVYRASWPDERVIRATLGTIAAEVAKSRSSARR